MTEFEKRGLAGSHTRKYQKHPGVMYKGKLCSWQDLEAMPEADANASNIRAKAVKMEARLRKKHGDDYQLTDADLQRCMKMMKPPPPKKENEETAKEKSERLERELWEQFEELYLLCPIMRASK